MSARDDVLGRIAGAYAAAPPPPLSYADITREYRTTSTKEQHELVDLLIDRLLDYKATVRPSTMASLADTIAAALAEQGAALVVAPAGIDPTWTAQTHAEIVPDPRPEGPLSLETIDLADGVLTGCAVAVAATGTIVLDASADQGRRLLTLIPDYHLCVVRADQVCADVPRAIAQLDPTRPTTLISGPSATSDIELNRVEGVHGPRTLEVIVVTDT